VNRTAGILFLLLYLFVSLVPAGVKEELAKCAQLIEHFHEHRAETPDLSFFNFLALHYGEAFAEHRSDHNHSDLPGKTSQSHSHVMACSCSVPALPASVHWQITPPQTVVQTPAPGDETLHSYLRSSGIWQPPRVG
jgi:hypothetical protein